MATGALVAVAFLALVISPVLAAADDGYITGQVSEKMVVFGIPMSGSPIEHATVSAVGTSYTTSTDDNGNYNLSLPAGNYTVQVTASGYHTATSGVLAVTSGNETIKNFLLDKPAGNLTGTVTDADDGTPMYMVMIQYGTELLSPSAFTDSIGRYTLSNLPVGVLNLTLTSLSPLQTLNFTAEIKDGKNTVKDFQLKTPTYLEAVVKDSNGKPLSGATVTVGGFSGTTDATGVARVDVVPGTYDVKVTADGFQTYEKKGMAFAKGDGFQLIVQLPKSSGAGVAGSMAILAIAGIAVVIVVVVVAVFFMRKKKPAPAAGAAAAPGAAPGAPGAQTSPAVPPKTQAEKMKEWMDYERMYGRPHPEAPGWVTPGGAAANAPKPKCPVDEITINFEPFTGQYFCHKCGQRYTAEQVFKKEDELLEHSRPTAMTGPAAAGEELARPPAAEKLDLSSAPPSWSTEHGQTMSGEEYVAPSTPAAAPLPTPQTAPVPPTAAPMEAAPVTSEGPVPEAAPVLPEGVNPEAGPIFNMPKPVDYSELPPPAPAKEPPKLDEEK